MIQKYVKPHILQYIKIIRHRIKNPLVWKMLSGLEQIVMGGRYRIIVIKRITQIIGFYRLSPYRPKGIISSFESWLEDSIPPQMEGSCIKKIIPEHSSYLKKPNHINNEVHPNFIDCMKSSLLTKSYLCLLKNASIVDEKGIIISYDEKVYTEFNFENDDFAKKSDVFKSYINKPEFKKECLASIASNAYSNTFHWTFDVLPRLKLFENILDDIDYLIVPDKLSKFQLDSLTHLGLSESNLLKLKNGTHLQCEKLFAASFPRKKGHVSKWACEFLRESFIPKNTEKPYRFIYISRKDAFFRRITNEEKVENYLISLGFEIIQMSKLSFMEQIRIFAEARVVVGPHGAGLTNIVFCQNAKILEIFSPSYVPTMYWMISNNVGNEYYYLLGEDEPGNTHPEWKNFTIDMSMFKQTMKMMLEDI
ncbi:Protein of unknown function [Methanococcoides vulcani]|uniref:EGF domain-specific O-linked N-acetylglucosamine transferase n=2 Tax=Methanococcoides vulcani TaxID=1353158 RepID=A0A1I0ARG0_9EURY|nr:Protein of unknown function [Methanococcoides vulcani]